MRGGFLRWRFAEPRHDAGHEMTGPGDGAVRNADRASLLNLPNPQTENTTMTKRPDQIPTVEIVVQWVKQDIDGFAARFHHARRIGFARCGGEIFEIANGALDDLMSGDAPSRDEIAHALLRIMKLCGPLTEIVPGLDDVMPARSVSRALLN
jgi:hypothetical protein